MKVVVALDKFKGSLDAPTACEIVATAIRSVHAPAEVISKPMADGGDGTAATLVTALHGNWRSVSATGPLPGIQCTAMYGWFPDQHLAVVEMATASGLALLKPEERDPLRTTTYGTGELLRDAMQLGAQKILLGVGGSATVDGGVGAAMALGWRFLDEAGQPVGRGGGELERIRQIVGPPSRWPEIEVLCDVDNPLCGEPGAARVFGPQKGATPVMIERLDAGLRHLAMLTQQQLHKDIRDVPGAGAAGGLAGGAIAFLNAKLVPGIETVIKVTGLGAAMRGADWVITGEGRFDEQSWRGKVVSGVAKLARQHGGKVAVLAGSAEISQAEGVDLILSARPDGMSLEQALANAPELLAERAGEMARQL
jgi:glycerate kinase